ncbi:MAG: hypothetical protein A2932_01290 [Candidatus Spechtbacteria bacterium RIFCSPLOWO2_01_FULL_46_10]|uniref:Bacterial spore germination immunoglobulin-like domain-containing protein n=1 Tax=Candidatus Spechtbacteria bacterium RIFCSPLOWO2_01_FULL_46_10 TaxID=1802163 RepID=A0A1G2HH14_9BACT|nr:MAG: hypothetical protein A2932_01290 [Candidatus Spechtbacteria bacterium RIFCSPLOWO2_01_FULL_46_10]
MLNKKLILEVAFILAFIALLIASIFIIFIRDIGTTSRELERAQKTDIIRVETPRINEAITSPLIISGEARGTWFFEASFPARLLDASGNEIAVMPVTAQEEWMTEDFVSFYAILEFEAPASQNGTLIFEKDNPSGLPQYADKLEIPVKFFAAP